MADFEAPVEHFELWDFILKDFPKRVVLEFVNGADTAKQVEIEKRLHNTLARTLEAFPGPTFPIGNPFEGSTPSSGHETNTNLNSTTSPPDGDQWIGDEREAEPWLGWFKPPGAISRASHLAHRRAP
jgi:hypothetical protein